MIYRAPSQRATQLQSVYIHEIALGRGSRSSENNALIYSNVPQLAGQMSEPTNTLLPGAQWPVPLTLSVQDKASITYTDLGLHSAITWGVWKSSFAPPFVTVIIIVEEARSG